MAELKWTLQAADGLEAITEFIANDSRRYEGLFTMRLLDAVERLRSLPGSGRMVPEADNPAIRDNPSSQLPNYLPPQSRSGGALDDLSLFSVARHFTL
jgi:plasmid stabilization system protein ParE